MVFHFICLLSFLLLHTTVPCEKEKLFWDKLRSLLFVETIQGLKMNVLLQRNAKFCLKRLNKSPVQAHWEAKQFRFDVNGADEAPCMLVKYYGMFLLRIRTFFTINCDINTKGETYLFVCILWKFVFPKIKLIFPLLIMFDWSFQHEGTGTVACSKIINLALSTIDYFVVYWFNQGE